MLADDGSFLDRLGATPPPIGERYQRSAAQADRVDLFYLILGYIKLSPKKHAVSCLMKTLKVLKTFRVWNSSYETLFIGFHTGRVARGRKWRGTPHTPRAIGGSFAEFEMGNIRN